MAPGVPAILIAQPRVFTVDVESLAGGRPGDEVEGFLGKAAHGLHGIIAIQTAAAGVEMPGQASAFLKPGEGQSLGQVEILHREGRRVRIGIGLKGVVVGAEHVPAKVAGRKTDAGGGGDGDVPWHTRPPRSQLVGGDGADARKARHVIGPADPHVLGREHAVAAGKMVPGVVVKRPDDGELVGHAGLLGKHFADIKARNARADRPPDAAVFSRGIGLEVVKVHVAGTAV